jgi:hypothetical protein
MPSMVASSMGKLMGTPRSGQVNAQPNDTVNVKHLSL